jgi:hypothetical protein
MKIFLYISFVLLFFQLTPTSVLAQGDKSSKEEINITSSFKPSIIKSSKIEFRPDAIARDTTRYAFSYEPVKLSFNTPMSGFTIKPLAYNAPVKEVEGDQLIAHLGYGNLKSPFGSISYASGKADQFLHVNADYLSMKGKLPGQQHAIGTLGASFKKRISENYQFKIGSSIEDFNYRTFGFDKQFVNIRDEDLKQRFTNFNLNASLHNIAGEEGKMKVNPFASFDYLTTNQNYYTVSASIGMHADFKWKKDFLFKSSPMFSWMHVNAVQRSFVENVFLLQWPVGATIIFQKWNLDVKALPVYFNRNAKVVPNIFVKYNLDEGKWTPKGGFLSTYEINSPFKMLMFNPFINPQLNLISPVYEQHYLFAGFDFQSKNGLSIDFQAGLTQHKNLPLFINSPPIGKDFMTIFESSLRTVDLKTNLTYTVNSNVSFSSNLKWTYFQRQTMYEKPFGMIPFQWELKTEWKPIEKLHFSFGSSFWTGSYANNSISTVKLKSAADLRINVKYNLNEKWGFWIDLNNIANIQYQRWNQYTAYGFNVLGGVRYALGKTAKR